MARPEKVSAVEEVKEKISRAKGTVLADYRGLKVAELAEVRRNLSAQGIDFKIYKNTLSKIAAEESGFKELNAYLEGPTAIAFSYEDAVAAAKVLSDFARAHSNLSLKGGIIEGKVVDAVSIQAIAKLPGREVLLAQAVGMMQAPITNFVRVLQGPIRALAIALGQVAEGKA